MDGIPFEARKCRPSIRRDAMCEICAQRRRRRWPRSINGLQQGAPLA
jgi:hypothetical protein